MPDDRPAGAIQTASDRSARPLVLVPTITVGLLVLFIAYLCWKSCTVAAPWVLWSSASHPVDPLLHSGSVGITEFQNRAALLQAEQPLAQPPGSADTSTAQPAGIDQEQVQQEPDEKAEAGSLTEQPVGEEEEEEEEEGPQPPSPEKLASRREALERGLRLYRNAGCTLCHGPEGRGGVANPNYLKNTFPALDKIASRLGLEFPEDAEVVVDLLSAGKSLDKPAEVDIPDAGIVAAKYVTIANVIMNGNPAMKKDPNGAEPIYMPSYKDKLSKAEMNQILAALLIKYPVEEEEWEEEEEDN